MNNVIPQDFSIERNDRNKLNNHNSFVVWFTGLSGSGKSTIANRVEKELFSKGIRTISLDGDNIRSGLNRDLKFSRGDREENLRRIGEISKLFVSAGNVVIASFIAPLESDRDAVKNIIGKQDYIEIYINTPLEVCEQRDVKGLYKKARKGEIKNFTGIDAPYEKPKNPDIEIITGKEAIKEATERIILYLNTKLEINK